jgi:putative flippase GtrA
MYVAQLAAHVLGTIFNYYTYSRYAFRDPRSSKIRFFLSYAANYLVGAIMLWACAQLIPSPYLAMAVAIVIYTSVNYVVLNRFVFTTRPKTQ